MPELVESSMQADSTNPINLKNPRSDKQKAPNISGLNIVTHHNNSITRPVWSLYATTTEYLIEIGSLNCKYESFFENYQFLS